MQKSSIQDFISIPPLCSCRRLDYFKIPPVVNTPLSVSTDSLLNVAKVNPIFILFFMMIPAVACAKIKFVLLVPKLSR